MDNSGDSTCPEVISEAFPEHIAIIMDGNGRWAEAKGKMRHTGHKEGVSSVRTTIEFCAKSGIKALTLFAFSSENWQRPKVEVSLLMELFLNALQSEVKQLHSNNIRLRILGDRSAFSSKLQKSIALAESITKENTGLLVQIAANYGGRWDIVEATKKIAAQVVSGELTIDDIDEDILSGMTSFSDIADPDLFIRTGGDLRISNFLLWQCAYTEFYFTETLWPDFDVNALALAITDFSTRQRRFGKTGAQIAE